MILDTRERLEMTIVRELVFIKVRFFKKRRYCRLLESWMERKRFNGKKTIFAAQSRERVWWMQISFSHHAGEDKF